MGQDCWKQDTFVPQSTQYVQTLLSSCFGMAFIFHPTELGYRYLSQALEKQIASLFRSWIGEEIRENLGFQFAEPCMFPLLFSFPNTNSNLQQSWIQIQAVGTQIFNLLLAKIFYFF